MICLVDGSPGAVMIMKPMKQSYSRTTTQKGGKDCRAGGGTTTGKGSYWVTALSKGCHPASM